MKNTALVIIDVQKGFDDPFWGTRNNPNAEKNISLLLSEWRKHHWPIIHVQHLSTEPDSPLRPGQPGCEFKDEVRPLAGEEQFTKTVNSAFIGTGLEEFLLNRKLGALVIVGLTTDHCVSTTTRMAANLGFDVILVSDSAATFDRKGHQGTQFSASSIHDVHLASLNGEFCVVRSTGEILNEIS